MLEKFLKFFRKIAAPFLERWNRLPLRWKGVITTILPITAIIISSIFAFFGNRSRQAIESDIQRKFQLVSTFNEVLTLTVNAETGMRGYQLTKREEFLQPYEIAQKNLPEKMAALQSLIEAEPGEKPRVEKLNVFSEAQDLVKLQISDLEWQKDHITKNGEFDEELYSHILTGKKNMDSIRALLGRMEQRESELLSERIEEINDIRKRDYILVFVTLAIALITRIVSWYLFDTGIKQRIQQAVIKLRERRNAEKVEEETKGEIDSLEEEVEILCRAITNESESETGRTTKQK